MQNSCLIVNIFLCSIFLLASSAAAQNTTLAPRLDSIAQIEGRYYLIASKDTIYTNLDWICMMNHRLDWRYFRDHRCYMEIRQTRRNRLGFTLWEGDRQLKSSYMKASIRDGQVYVIRRKLRIFTLVFNVFNIHHARMALTDTGDLLVTDANLGGCGMLVFFPFACAGDRTERLVFERVR